MTREELSHHMGMYADARNAGDLERMRTELDVVAAASEEAARAARIDELVTFNRHANERPSSDIPYWLVDYTRNRMGALRATPPTQGLAEEEGK